MNDFTVVFEGQVTITQNNKEVQCEGSKLKCKHCPFEFTLKRKWSQVQNDPATKKAFQSRISAKKAHEECPGPTPGQEPDDEDSFTPMTVLDAKEINDWKTQEVEEVMKQKGDIPAEITSVRAMPNPRNADGNPFFVVELKNKYHSKTFNVNGTVFFAYDKERYKEAIALLPPKEKSQQFRDTLQDISRLDDKAKRQASVDPDKTRAVVLEALKALDF